MNAESESTLRNSSAEPTKSARRTVSAYVLKGMCAGLIVLALALVPRPACAQPSSEPPVVELSVDEADSVMAAIDDLEVALWECRQLARQDSLYYEDRLQLQEKAHKEILQAYKDERPGWLERLVKQPVVWLAIGMWVGVQAR